MTTTKFYLLPCAVARIPSLSPGAKLLFSVLYFKAGGSDIVEGGAGTLAKYIGTNKQTVRRQIIELESAGLVRAVRGIPRTQYYLMALDRCGSGFGGGLIRIPDSVLKCRDLNNNSQRLLLCLISYMQAGKDWFWAKQKDLAAELGLSARTINRDLAAMKAKGEVQIRLRRLNRKAGNKYRVT